MAANVAFSIRPDSFNARYAPGGATGNKSITTPTVDSGAGTGIIGNSVLNLDQGAASTYGVFYRGTGNIPKTQKMSILIRCALGTTAGTTALFGIGGFPNIGNMGAFFTGNTLRGFTENYSNGSDILILNCAWTPTTATYYDIVYLIDMSTSAAANCKIYVDGVQVGSSATPSATWSANRIVEHMQIALGSTYFSGTTTTRIKVNEFVIWDDIIDPTSGGLNLNGASRSSFVTASALDGLSYSDPGIANVRSSTSYTQAGVSLTGTAAIPTAANVLSGVSVDATTGTYVTVATGNVKTGTTYGAASALTGTYDGSDRWTDPGIANVRSATAYKANSTSNNRTGTASIPTAANVRLGTSVDATTGTAAIPTAANVRSGTATDASTGTLIVPSVANVLSGVSVDASTGTYVVASASDVKTGVTFGPASSSTGTYDGSDRWTDPGVSNVRSATAYKANSATNNRTGTASIPAAADVRFSTSVDATTGTLAVPAVGNVRSGISVDASTGTLIVPSLANTKIGVSGDGGTGSYDGSDRWTDPGVANTRLATAYKANSTSNNRTGTASIPVAANVRSGTATDATTGSLAVPAASDVRLGTAVDATTGTLVIHTSTNPGAANVATGIAYTIDDVAYVGTRDVITNIIDNTTLTASTFEATLEAE